MLENNVAFEDGQLARTTNFNHGAIDEANGWFEPGDERVPDSVPFADMSACFVLVLEWMLTGKDLRMVGGRCAALAAYLDPINSSKFGTNLAEIAKNCGATRASLSKSLVDFRDSVQIHLSNGKRACSRQVYRDAQASAVKAGCHSSVTRRDRISNRDTKS